MNDRITFLYCVDLKYYKFVLPFLAFALKYHPTDVFEIYVAINTNTNFVHPVWFDTGISLLKQQYPNAIIDINICYTRIPPNKLRFLLEPKYSLITNYTYIGDIDILLCENILDFHINHMKKYNIYFSNIVRPNSDRLSGLHFVQNNIYFQKTHHKRTYHINNLNTLKSDEQMLFNICSDFIPKEFFNFTNNVYINRPPHGQHISLNRKPFLLHSPMSNTLDTRYKINFLNCLSDEKIKNILLLNNEYIMVFNKYLTYINIPGITV